MPGAGARVCSCHFRDGKRENDPEIFPHNLTKLFEEHHLSPEKKKMRRLAPETETFTLDPQPSTSTDDPTFDVEHTEIGASTSETIAVSTDTTDLIQSSNIILEAENSLLKMEIERKDKIINTLQMHMSYENICQSDKLILEYTGLPTRNVFESLFSLLKDVDIKYYLKWNVRKITRIDQLLLTLMKLRQNFSHVDLAFRFQISEATVANIVVTFTHVLYESLHKNLMAAIPSKEKNKSCLPSCCSTFTNCKIIIDCTDIFCMVPRQSMKNQR
ncbi:thap domain protein [Holotrichia oblita]|uniref:Thap domain protein n=1 Tax=Holotrichia oblita TaxID=644536 RepID=A0ACB9SLM5_HOLOL|nr:thap domain protein [Holotrichia oblita]